MNSIGRIVGSPALIIAMLTVPAALVGTAIADSSGKATTSVSALKVSREALRTAKRALAVAEATSKQQGLKGDIGAPGSKGDKGDPGAPGVSGWQRIQGQTAGGSPHEQEVTVVCPPGKRILGGGATIYIGSASGGFGNVALESSGPVSDTEWYARAHEHDETGVSWIVRVSVICGNVT